MTMPQWESNPGVEIQLNKSVGQKCLRLIQLCHTQKPLWLFIRPVILIHIPTSGGQRELGLTWRPATGIPIHHPVGRQLLGGLVSIASAIFTFNQP
jgi:hypothetical protein